MASAYHPSMNPRSPVRAIVVAGLLIVLAACTPPPSTSLAVRNDSGETFYVRLEGPSGQAPVMFRVDPGAHGQAVAPGDEQPATRLVVYSGTCDALTEESNPQLGSLDIDGAGSMSFNVGMTRTEFRWPVLPTEDACG
jgi:hypothetical protein